MQRIDAPARTLPLYRVASTRTIEQQALAGLAPHALMQRAGSAVARLALALAPHARRAWVAAGPGNNGGDGIVAAMQLLGAGKEVIVTLLGDPQRLPDDAKDAWTRAQAAGVRFETDAVPEMHAGDIAIDALLGIGASRAPDATMAGLIEALNALACDVLAVDLPSGLNVETGQPFGAQAVIADHTLALLTLKPGLFTGAGRDHAGTVWLDDLQVDAAHAAPDAWLIGALDAALPRRRHAQHKGSFGDVAVVGGAPSMSGAALLAARAALGAGAGRVFVNLLDAAAPALDPLRAELMFRAEWWKSDDATLARTTVVCGCGGGAALRHVLPRLLGSAGRLVLDADALNTIAADTQLQAQLVSRAARQRFTVLTPHPLEAARLLGQNAAQVQGDRLAAAQALAERFDAVVVLKGSGSVVAAPAARVPCINPTGSAALASAGTGDVLAGWLGGLWAQQASDGIDVAMRVACGAVHAHGAAADASGRRLMLAADLIDALALRG
jgi:hydroxyethylthiazole kinase-like uncharacterized protein yjeF